MADRTSCSQSEAPSRAQLLIRVDTSSPHESMCDGSCSRRSGLSGSRLFWASFFSFSVSLLCYSWFCTTRGRDVLRWQLSISSTVMICSDRCWIWETWPFVPSQLWERLGLPIQKKISRLSLTSVSCYGFAMLSTLCISFFFTQGPWLARSPWPALCFHENVELIFQPRLPSITNITELQCSKFDFAIELK
jgi:hypothetical protein